jgi:shikimate kinase
MPLERLVAIALRRIAVGREALNQDQGREARPERPNDASRIQDTAVALIGYRGAGKTTVARHLARRLGWDSVDADELLESRCGMSIQQIFAEKGEPWFRDVESQILAELVSRPQTVLALGGGVILRTANREELAKLTVVWLDAPAECLFQRIQEDAMSRQRRPNLTRTGGLEEVERLLIERRPLYQQSAHYRLNVRGKSPEQLAEEIFHLLEPRIQQAET